MALLPDYRSFCVLHVATCISRVICCVLHATSLWNSLKFVALVFQGCSREQERSLPLHALRLALATEGPKEGISL